MQNQLIQPQIFIEHISSYSTCIHGSRPKVKLEKIDRGENTGQNGLSATIPTKYNMHTESWKVLFYFCVFVFFFIFHNSIKAQLLETKTSYINQEWMSYMRIIYLNEVKTLKKVSFKIYT